MTATPQSGRKVAGQIRHRLVLAVDDLRINDRNTILRALTFAEEVYDKYRKKTRSFPERGIPLIAHPMRVALVLLEELELKDVGAVAAALLHELVEWKRDQLTIADIERNFGRPIAMLVSILTKPHIEPDDSAEERLQKLNTYYRRLEQASIVSKIVKLADRLDSVREAPDWLEVDVQRKYLEETRAIYIPIAENTDSYLYEELVAAADTLDESLKTPTGTESSSDFPEIWKSLEPDDENEEEVSDKSKKSFQDRTTT